MLKIAERWLFGLVKRLAPAQERRGVDPEQLRAILALKLLLDQRRPAPLGLQQQTGSDSAGSQLWMRLSFLYGAFIGFYLILPLPPVALVAFSHTFIVVNLGLVLLSDFHNVFLPETDSTVLGSRPVGEPTLLAARLFHAGFYLGQMVLAFSAGTLLIGTFKFSIAFAPAFLLALTLETGLTLAVVFLFFLGAQRIFSPSRFRSLVSWIQMLLSLATVSVYMGTQLMVDHSGFHTIDSRIYLLPTTWFAVLTLMVAGKGAGLPLGPAALSVALSLGGMAACVWLFRFLTRNPAAAARGTRSPTPPRPSGLADKLAALLGRKPATRAATALILRQIARDRGIRLRTIPGLVLGVGVTVVLLRNLGRAPRGSLLLQAQFVLVFYLSSLFGLNPVFQLQTSEHWKAAWVFTALPFDRPGVILRSSLIAVAAALALPFLAITATLGCLAGGPLILVHAVHAFAAAFFAILLLAFWKNRVLPFSQPATGIDRNWQVILSFLLMLVFALFGIIQTFLGLIPWLLGLSLLVLIGANGLLLALYGRLNWEQLR